MKGDCVIGQARLRESNLKGDRDMTARLAAPKGESARASTRLPVSLEKATGIGRDMSDAGAFFWISGRHSIGTPISFSIGLKTEYGPMAWVCCGEVLRTERRGDDVGAIVKITRTAVEAM